MSTIKTLTEATFEAEVLGSTGTVMVDFGAEWCGPCKVLEPIMEKVASEVSFNVFKVDIDDCPNLAKKFGIRGVPTVIVFQDGKVSKTNVGLTNKDALLKLGNG